jgi:hypothetical protein
MLVAKINLVVSGLALTPVPRAFLSYHSLDEVQKPSSIWWVFGIGVVFVLAIAVLLYYFLKQVQRSKNRQVYSVKIVNEGNERDGYELQVEDPSGALGFTLVLNGAKLPQRNVSAAPSSDPIKPSTDAGAPSGSAATREDKSPARATGGKGAGMMGIANAIAGLLAGVGSLLPPSLRSPVMQVATKIRAGQSSVRRVQQMPRRIARVARVSKPVSSSAPRQPVSGAVVQHAPYAEPEAFGALAGTQTWARTPSLEPGSTLTVDLLIDPVDPYWPGISLHPFVVRSRSIQQSEGTLVVEEGEAQVTGMTRIQRYGPILVAFTLACTAISIMAILVF